MMWQDDLLFGYLTHLELINIRGFKKLELDLSHQDQPWMKSVIIGRNGTNKSTLLRAIALALSPESEANALIASGQGSYLREGEYEGRISVRIWEPDPGREYRICLDISGSGRNFYLKRSMESNDPPPTFFVCAYGAGRGLAGTSSEDRYRHFEAVGSLFDYERRLLNTEIILRRLFDYKDSDIFEPAMQGIKRLLELRPDHQIDFRKGGGVQISGPGIGEAIPLDALADGYRMTFSWVIDFYGRAMQAEAITAGGGIRGILLLDEIEQHLHPSMQSELLSQLQGFCPELQIFATTHSPLTALGANDGNVISLQRDKDTGQVRPVPVPPLTGYSAEDALVETALFGTNPYPQTTQEDLERYRELSQLPPEDLDEEDTEKLQELITKLDPSFLPAQKEDPIIDKLDQVLRMLEGKGEDE